MLKKLAIIGSAILALWKLIEQALDWIGLIDQVRSMMDPTHWFAKLLFWPHLGTVASIIGVMLLFLILVETRRHRRPLSGPSLPSVDPIASPSHSGAGLVISTPPEEITALYKGRTTFQADALFNASFKGKRLQVTGTLADVNVDVGMNGFGIVVTLAEYDGLNAPHVMCIFHEKWKDRLTHLPVGHRIVLAGALRNADSYTVTLEDCTLVTPSAIQ